MKMALSEAKVLDFDKIRVSQFFSNDNTKFENKLFAGNPYIAHYKINSKSKWYLMLGTSNFW